MGAASSRVELAAQSCCKLSMKFGQGSVSDRTRRARVLVILLVSVTTAGAGCNSAQSAEQKQRQAEERARLEREKQQAQEATERDSQAAEEAQALAKKKEQEAAREAQKKQQDKFASCCEALARAGFEGRSMEYMKGADACAAAQKEEKSLAEVLPTVRQALKTEKLPEACADP